MPATEMRSEALRVAICGALALAVAMGIGRFAFTPLLPIMLHDGVVDLTAGGWLATANYFGYFLGALLCMVLNGGPVRLIRMGLAATVLLTLGMGIAAAPPLWLLILLRALAGIASALVFVFVSGWCLQRLVQLQAAALGGIIYCGPGLGIFLTGLPGGAMAAHGWPAAYGWLAFGVLALLLSACVWRTFSGSSHNQTPIASHAQQLDAVQLKRQTIGLVLGYGVAGFGYIITATFLPVIARQALPGSHWPDLFWPLFGLCIALGALLATRIPVHCDNRLLLAICYLLQAGGVLSSICLPNVAGYALSSILLGMPFTAITLFAMRDARRLRGEQARSLMGLLTAAYGIGQIIGPPLATQLVLRTGSFTAALSVAAVMLLAGACLFGAMYRQAPAAQADRLAADYASRRRPSNDRSNGSLTVRP